ncbi:MAG: xanthine dehydrogenase family protein subunit M [Anaerolineales bacterium]
MSKSSDFFMPERWDEALALRKRFEKDSVVLAGGTDVMILITRGMISPKHIISLSRMPSWGSYELNGSVTFSAGTTFRKIEREAALLPVHTALVNAASQVGGVQVRNVATIGGNLCNASPAADSAPPLLVMDAEIVVYGPVGNLNGCIESCSYFNRR